MGRRTDGSRRGETLQRARHGGIVCVLLLVLGRSLGEPMGVGAAAPDRGGTIVWAVHESMPSFDLHDETSYIAAQPLGPLYNGLVTFDVYDNEHIVGDLAERWEITDGGMRITFTLRPGVLFHDGAAFTCADAQYSLEKLADPKRAHGTFVAVLQEVVAAATCTDTLTLVLTLTRPSAALMTMLAGAHAVMMRAGIAERVDRTDPRFLVGTGPFRYTSYTPGVEFRAERNPHYWKPGLPYLEGYQAVVLTDLPEVFASFRARRLTMTGIGRHLERSEAAILHKDVPDAVVAIGPRAGWDTLVMNLSKPPFQDPRMRHAVALATDREKMIAMAAQGWGVLGGYIGFHTPYGLPLEALKQYPQFRDAMTARQAEATRLVGEAGYAHGVEIAVVGRRGPMYERAARSRQEDLHKVGIHMHLTLLDTAGFRHRIEQGDFQAYEALSGVAFDDPDFYYARLVCKAPSNLGRYCNPAFDQLFAEQSQTFEPIKRAVITRQMERLLLQDVPDDRGFYWRSAMGYWNRVQHWPPVRATTVFNFGKFEQVWCQGGQCM
jgi:peptide/nickel transport system substrate-binding protein